MNVQTKLINEFVEYVKPRTTDDFIIGEIYLLIENELYKKKKWSYKELIEKLTTNYTALDIHSELGFSDVPEKCEDLNLFLDRISTKPNNEFEVINGKKFRIYKPDKPNKYCFLEEK